MGCDPECGEDQHLCDAGYDMDGNFSLFANSVQGILVLKAQVALYQWNASQPKAPTTTLTPCPRRSAGPAARQFVDSMRWHVQGQMTV